MANFTNKKKRQGSSSMKQLRKLMDAGIRKGTDHPLTPAMLMQGGRPPAGTCGNMPGPSLV